MFAHDLNRRINFELTMIIDHKFNAFIFQINNVYRNSDNSAFLGNGSRQSLYDPQQNIRAAFCAFRQLKLFDTFYQTQTTSLYQIVEQNTTHDKSLRQTDNQTQISRK